MSWLHSHPNPQIKIHDLQISKAAQHDLYHNRDPLYRFVGKSNESTVLVEGQNARALIDSGSQLSSISLAWVKKQKLNPHQVCSVLQIEGSGGLDVPYVGYVETHLKSA